MRTKFTFLVASLIILSFAGPATAQTAKDIPMIGILGQGTPDNHSSRFKIIRKTMRDLGYIEGRNVRFEIRYANGKRKPLFALAAELVRLGADVIVTSGTLSTRAARKASGTIPIVMNAGNPVKGGLITSLARPGGNITGLTVFPGPNFYCQRLEILKEAVPSALHIGVLWVPANSSHQLSLKSVKACAPGMGLKLLPQAVAKPADVEKALASLTRERADAFLYFGSGLIGSQRKRMIAFARTNRLPLMSTRGVWVRAGAFISYGADLRDISRRKATYIDKILKGANPAELPVERPTKFEMVVNLKTAKALGLTVPHSILLQATEVIE